LGDIQSLSLPAKAGNYLEKDTLKCLSALLTLEPHKWRSFHNSTKNSITEVDRARATWIGTLKCVGVYMV